MKLAVRQPRQHRRPTVPLWCKFWCNSRAHVIPISESITPDHLWLNSRFVTHQRFNRVPAEFVELREIVSPWRHGPDVEFKGPADPSRRCGFASEIASFPSRLGGGAPLLVGALGVHRGIHGHLRRLQHNSGKQLMTPWRWFAKPGLLRRIWRCAKASSMVAKEAASREG
jgi:hypothetical protein